MNGGPWTSAAEINLLGATGQVLSRTAWTVSADSAELVSENGAVTNAVDGSTKSFFWHTAWLGATMGTAPLVKINQGVEVAVSGLTYLPRQTKNPNGTITQSAEFFVSHDGVTWGSPVAQGTFTGMGTISALKTVSFTPPAPSPLLVAPVVAPIAPSGATVTFTASATGAGPAGLLLELRRRQRPTGFTTRPRPRRTCSCGRA